MIRELLPHTMTASRAVLGAAAIVAALDGQLRAAATLIAVSALADGLDGHVARWLGAATPFGALFDYFCDYLTLVVAPWTLGRMLLGDLTAMQEIGLGLPLLTAAIRYARNGETVVLMHPAPDLPGVGTVFSAFVSVVAVFLDAHSYMSSRTLGILVPTSVAVLAILMLAPVHYPKLTRFRGWSPTVLVLLAVMPFAGTTVLAAVAILLGVLYIIVGPFLARRL